MHLQELEKITSRGCFTLFYIFIPEVPEGGFLFSFFPFFHFQVLGAATWERASFFLTDSKRNMAATAVKFISIKTDKKKEVQQEI